jgi:hypothetical protein
MSTPRINSITLPRQRLPYKQKNLQWRKDCVDYADRHSFYNNERVRKSLQNKIINLNLYNGIVDVRDLTNVVNPHQIDASFVPDNIPHNPILVPKIDLLVGEEIKRRFDWSVIVTNPDAISKKEEDKKLFLKEKITDFIKSNYKDEELKAKMDELAKHMKYSWQDIREKTASQILKHYSQEQRFDRTFNDGFKDALIFAEEIYQCDIIHDEPVMIKLNPLKVHTVRSGNSDRIEDSSIIIIQDHWSPHKIIDVYHDELKPEDIDYILEYSTTSSKGSYSDDQNNHVLLRDALNTGVEGMYDTIFNLAELNGHFFGSNYTDDTGNIRVLKVLWKSIKQVKKIKFYDEYGEEQYKTVSEEYIPNKTLGEEETSMWVSEWWEGVKIGKDIYLNLKPRKVQYNKLHNPSICGPGIVGQIYNTNQSKAVSLVDRCKNYQYMYDVIWDRLNKAISTNYGKIMELDISKIPENWEMDKWLHFAVVNKIAVIDSFKEGNQGAATGKLAGSMNTQGGRVMDMETGSYIQQHIQLLEFIKMEMGEIAGVTAQRQGQIDNRETVGGVERSVNQSSHITEYWFMLHEQCKIRVLECFLETAKEALKGNSKKAQYILDDQSIQILNLDPEEFCENDYGLVITSSSKTQELEQMIKSNAQAFLQNGGTMSTIMDIYFSPSLSDMRRRLEEAEEQIHQRNSEASQQQSKDTQAAMAQAAELENRKLELEQYKIDKDSDTKIYIEQLKLSMQPDEVVEDDGVVNPLDIEKLNLDKEKVKNSHLEKMLALKQDMDKHKDQMDAKKVDQSINRIKKKTTTKG